MGRGLRWLPLQPQLGCTHHTSGGSLLWQRSFGFSFSIPFTVVKGCGRGGQRGRTSHCGLELEEHEFADLNKESRAKDNDELIQKNYKLAAQECYVQNTARHYAKIYAAEAQPLEGFGEVPEIIPIFLIHRPQNNIPYATVEEELMGEFVKYSIRDGKEINFLRRDSEAGQKCCTFQHWVYQKTGGCLLVTDMQGVGMKLTDVGIATLAKGYKGFKGNCSMSFIDQFKALHQCNKYCKMLGLKSLQNNSQKPKKPIIGKARVQANSPPVKTPDSGTPAERKAQHP